MLMHLQITYQYFKSSLGHCQIKLVVSSMITKFSLSIFLLQVRLQSAKENVGLPVNL